VGTIKNFRWWIAGLIALATAINYLDRLALPVAITEIKNTIPISDSQFGTINSLFLFAYGTMYAVGGRIIDIMGSRTGYAIMIIWWSLANMAQGLVSSVMGLGIARFFLGAGEGGGFPGSAKVVSEWFPQKERAFAFGIFNTGSSLGGIVAPPLLALIITTMGWRWAFIISGLFGLVWVVAWLRVYSHPTKSKFVSAGEKAYIATEISMPVADEGRRLPWLSLFGYRSVWGLLAIKFLSDAAWFFFIFWLPKYLADVKGLSITSVGAYAWIPYAFAGAGSFIGGWFSSYLLKRGVSLDVARKICLGISAALLPASLFITEASLGMAIVFFSMAMFGHQSWATIVQTLAADMFPSRIVGSVAGLMGSVGTYGAMVFSLVIGFVIQEFGYNPAFLVAGILHPSSFVLVFLIIRKIEVVKLN
jgi:ACS family hexuronate transporter-like MFS transporter